VQTQYEKLIVQPLASVANDAQPIVLVLDALDECENDDEVRRLIHLLSQTNRSGLNLKAFVTSRPELPIRLGFRAIQGQYTGLILHQLPKGIVEHDIAAYLTSELAMIRDVHNSLTSEANRLPPSWPGQENMRTLVNMAVPLFIFAATVCRFIADSRCGTPDAQLQTILQVQRSGVSQLDATYLPVLRNLVAGLDQSTKMRVLQTFQTVVGTIIMLQSPLPARALSKIADVPQTVIDNHLNHLHSVISVPESSEAPVRILHLSFRDVLLDPDKKGTPFWVDQQARHSVLARRCLELVCTLERDICGLQDPTTPRESIVQDQIKRCLPPELQYACVHWIGHLEGAGSFAAYVEQVSAFLKRHALHWIEAMCLIGRISETLSMLKVLQSLAKAVKVRSIECIAQVRTYLA
jgi:hypothetical protein